MIAYDEYFMDNGRNIQDVNCRSYIELYIYDEVMTRTYFPNHWYLMREIHIFTSYLLIPSTQG